MKLIVILLFTTSSLPLLSQFTGKVDYPELGVSFIIPNGWIGQEYDEIFLMTNSGLAGVVALIPHEQSKNTEDLMKDFSVGFDLGSGTSLQQLSPPTELNEYQLAGVFRGTVEYTPAKAYIVGIVNPHGKGLTVIAASSEDTYQNEEYRGIAEQIALNVQFSAIQEQSNNYKNSVENRTEKEEWKYQLGGTKLTWMESYSSGGASGGGYNITEEIHLCEAGYFYYFDESFMSAGGYNSTAVTANQAQNRGTWDIAIVQGQPYLALDFQTGDKKQYRLEWRDDSKLYLEGYRYFRTWTGDNAPYCPN